MRVVIAALSVIAAIVLTTGARGDAGLPSPGVATGWSGVRAPAGTIRYVALPGRRETIVAKVRVHGGRVVHWGVLRGGFGVPLVAYDGKTGGLSADGRRLVLSSFDMRQFAVVSTRSLAVSRMISLHGMWSFDAVSPDAATLFLVQYSGTGPNVAYRIRAYDVTRNRLLPGAIVDRLEEEADMRGQPVTQATSPDGRWAYTLYARAKREPFVHALDTVRRAAYCVDLPLEMRLERQMALRLSFAQEGRVLTVQAGDRTMAAMNMKTFEVRAGG
jgi:hypothetical protein